MTPRQQFLADCAAVWDESDDRAVFVFGQPGTRVCLFAGPMTTHLKAGWLCFHLDHADGARVRQLIDALEDELDARAAH